MKKILHRTLSMMLTAVLVLSLTTMTQAATIAVSGVALDQKSITMSVGGSSATLKATIAPEDATNQNLNWKTDKAYVATVKNGVVKPVAAGTAIITVTTAEGGYSDTCQVNVVNDYVTDVTISPAGPGTLAAGKSTTLTAKVSYKYGGDGTNEVTWSSTDASVATVDAAGKVIAKAAGNATITATAKDAGNNGTKVTDTYKLTVGDAQVTLSSRTLKMTAGGKETLTYTMDPNSSATPVWSSNNETVATVSGGVVTGIAAGEAAITVNVGGMTDTCIVTVLDAAADTMSLSAVKGAMNAGQNLTFSAQAPTVTIQNGAADVTSNYTISYAWSSATAAELSKTATLETVASVPGEVTYLCQITAIHKSNKSQILTGTYSLTVTAYPAVAVQATVAVGSGPFTFGGTNSSTATSIQAQLGEKVPGLTHVIFDTGRASNPSSCGLLSATAGTAYYYSDSAGGDKLSGVIFTAAAARGGVYTVPFLAYGATTSYGLLTITVEGSASDNALYLCAPVGGAIKLTDSVFADWYKEQTGASVLNYVTLDSAGTLAGILKLSDGALIPGDGTKLYTATSAGTADKLLRDVSYQTAVKESAMVHFTCYGGSSTTDATPMTGTLYLLVPQTAAADMTFTVPAGTAEGLSDTGLTVGTASLRLLTLPSKGALYEGYVSLSNTGTKLTTEYINTKIYSAANLNNLTYVPDTYAAGMDTATYVAFGGSGTPLYTGALQFQLSTVAITSELTCDVAGLTFAGSTFYHSGDSDPIVSMVFAQPSSGRLVRSFAFGSGEIDEGARYYTDSVSNGTYHISTLTYVPRAGFTGEASIPYIATTKSGSSWAGTLKIKVIGKTVSEIFKDVTADNTGSWAAGAIDFAYTCGLVNGTEANTYSPATSMTRAMLVTVLYRAAESPTVVAESKFTDLEKGGYYENAVRWASTMGIINGTSATTFSPDAPVTREQIATILYRFADVMGDNTVYMTTLSGYQDIGSIDAYAVEGMTWAVDRGIITGTTTKTLSPLENATRAQVAVMLHRYLTY